MLRHNKLVILISTKEPRDHPSKPSPNRQLNENVELKHGSIHYETIYMTNSNNSYANGL